MAEQGLRREGADGMAADALFREGVACLQQERTAEADALFARVLEREPGHADALSNRGVIRCMAGDFATGIDFLKRARALQPRDTELRRNLVNAYRNLYPSLLQSGRTREGLVAMRELLALQPQDAALRRNLANTCRQHYPMLFERGEIEQGLDVLRQLLALEPGDLASRINLSDYLSQCGAESLLSDYAANLTPEELGCHILIACMPKSGSSFLKTALQSLSGWPELPLASAYLQNEQEIYLPHLVGAARDDTVTQQHLRATDPNLQIIQAFRIRPVVLVRNLFDIVPSFRDFYDDGAIRNTFLRGRWSGLDDAAKHDVIIDHVMPWYLAFYVSWQDAIATGRVAACRVSYEEMIADKPGTLQRIARHVGLDKSPADCAAAAGLADEDRHQTRFNRGVAGRGAETLTDSQKERLRRLADAYRDVDFSPVGL